VVKPTTAHAGTSDLDLLLGLALDLTTSLPSVDRHERLVRSLAGALPCDSAALLRRQGEDLVPVAVHGLRADAVGRRFPRAEHPRLDAICAAPGPVQFPPDSPLPDPFDGFLASDPHALAAIHACLGWPLRVEGELVGALAVDALEPGAFDGYDRRFLEAIGALAGAALRTSDLIETLTHDAARQGLVARDLMEEARERQGGHLIGTSDAMGRLREEVRVVAGSGMNVLITGETGVGKELVARAVHAASPRRDQPLIYVNCAALPESIAESELFGHRRGAFTGAEADRPGKFEVADGGTLFLDEIGELPPAVQPLLLRALQEGEIQRVGADEPRRVDVRVLAATNRELEEEVAAGRFRRDLFHRLDVYRIHVPPLRERPGDVGVLAGFFCDLARRRLGLGPVRIRPDALARLEAAPWPGNVRELEHAVSRAALRAAARAPRDGPVVLTAADLGVDGGGAAAGPAEPAPPAGEPAAFTLPAGQSLGEAVEAYKKALVAQALAGHDGNVAAAARALGVDRSNLHHLARRLGLR